MRAWDRHACASVAAVAVATLATQALAGASRVWVSGHGVDAAGCGAPTLPCRSLQYAHDSAVNAGGEIDILDPAGYGAVTITKAVSIVNDGVGTAGVQSTAGDAISIFAAPGDVVVLKGLSVDGQNAATNGIAFHSGRRLLVDHCTVRRVTAAGVLAESSTANPTVEIVASLLADNAQGVFISTTVSDPNTLSVLLDRVAAVSNSDAGLRAFQTGAGLQKITVSESNLSGNDFGLWEGIATSFGGTIVVEVDNSTLNSNHTTGLLAGSEVHLARSVLDLNGGFGVQDFSGAVFTAGDNHIEENATMNVSGALTPDTWR